MVYRGLQGLTRVYKGISENAICVKRLSSSFGGFRMTAVCHTCLFLDRRISCSSSTPNMTYVLFKIISNK